jgi:hypothetical protein
MRSNHRISVALLAAGLLIPTLSCNGTDLDEGDAADVVFLVEQIPQISPVSASVSGAVCTFTVPPVTVTLGNQPKTALAVGRPFNDIRVGTVTVSYVWDNGVPAAPAINPVTFNIGGTVPLGGTLGVSFPPVNLGDLSAAHGGHSANMTMVFRGKTVSGADVSTVGVGGVLSVNSCVAVDTDGDGLPNDTDPDDDNDGCPDPQDELPLTPGGICSP